jgi:hypothetical protein
MASAACDRPERPPTESSTATPGLASVAREAARPAVVDSSVPLDEALRRFRNGLPVVSRLSGGATSREALVRRFVRAVTRRDTTSAREMVLSRAEFAYLYYPHSPFTREPHKQMAGLVWFLTQANSSKGIARAFERLSGQPLRYREHRCNARPRRQGPNLLWEDCVVRLTDGGAQAELRLFGSIIQRDGRVKFVSYANDF